MPSAVCAASAVRVVHDDRPGHGGGGGVVVVALGAHRDAVGQQHLDRGRPGRLGQGVGVLADVSGPVMPWDARYSTIACVVAAMCRSLNAASRLDPRCPEVPNDDLLVGVVRVGRQVVVGADDRVDVDEVFGEGRLAGARVSHGPHSADRFGCARASPADRPQPSAEPRRVRALRIHARADRGFDRMEP